jgi:hypothetical protein
LPHKSILCNSPPLHTYYMPRLSYFSRFFYWTNTWWSEQTMKLLTV